MPVSSSPTSTGYARVKFRVDVASTFTLQNARFYLQYFEKLTLTHREAISGCGCVESNRQSEGMFGLRQLDWRPLLELSRRFAAPGRHRIVAHCGDAESDA